MRSLPPLVNCCLSGLFLWLALTGCTSMSYIYKAENGRTAEVKKILDGGFNVDTTERGRSALHYASQNGHIDTVKLLLRYGANPNLSDDGVTPLFVAAENGHAEIIKLLLAAGADPGIVWHDGYGNLPIHQACAKGHKDAALVLLEARNDLETKNDIGFTPLIIAARYGHDELVMALVKKGADVNAVEDDSFGALHYACWFGGVPMIEALLHAGADPNARGGASGLTPLHIAGINRPTVKEYNQIKELFLSSGADASITDYDGMLADTYAEQPRITRISRTANSPNYSYVGLTAAMAVWQYQNNMKSLKGLR